MMSAVAGCLHCSESKPGRGDSGQRQCASVTQAVGLWAQFYCTSPSLATSLPHSIVGIRGLQLVAIDTLARIVIENADMAVSHAGARKLLIWSLGWGLESQPQSTQEHECVA
jgi:hypothetical protein